MRMRRCEDEKMRDRPPLLEEPCAQTLSGIMSNLSKTYREGGGSHACDKYLSVRPIIFTRTNNDIPPQPGHSHGLELIHCGFPTFVSSEAAQKRYHKIRRLRRMKCLSRCWHKDFRSPSSPPAAAFCFLAVAVKMSAC